MNRDGLRVKGVTKTSRFQDRYYDALGPEPEAKVAS